MIVLNAKKMVRKKDAHEYLQQMLDLPDYYGKNLDALYDCLTEMGPAVFFFENADEGGDYFKKVLRVFKDAVRENNAISIAKSKDEEPAEEMEEENELP